MGVYNIKKQIEIIEMKNTKIKNGVDGFKWKLGTVEGKVNDLEHRSEDVKTNLWRAKMENAEKSIIGLWYVCLKYTYWSPRMGEGKWNGSNIWGDNGEDFPRPKNDGKPQVQEVLQTSGKISNR